MLTPYSKGIYFHLQNNVSYRSDFDEYSGTDSRCKKIQEMKEALAYYGSERDVFLFNLGINCGLRLSEMLGIKKKDIKEYTIKIREQKTGKQKQIPFII